MSKDIEEAIKEEKLQLTNFEINQLERSRYINPFRVTFSQNNCQRIWDGVRFEIDLFLLLEWGYSL